MGTDSAKLEKKRLKTEAKLEKKRMKALEKASKIDEQPALADAPKSIEKTKGVDIKTKNELGNEVSEKKVSWYKDPDWIRAIVGIASLIVAVIAIMITIL
jgi:hypothetical protein